VLNLTQFWHDDVRSPTGQHLGPFCPGGGNVVSKPMQNAQATALASRILAPYPKAAPLKCDDESDQHSFGGSNSQGKNCKRST